MLHDLQIALSRLASSDLQQKYCLNGTKDGYLLPEELLSSAEDWVEIVSASSLLTSHQLASIKKFQQSLDEVSNELDRLFELGGKGPTHTLSSNAWLHAREAAARCLAELGLDVRVDML